MPRKRKPVIPKPEKDPYAPWLSQWFITFNTNRTEEDFIEILEGAWEYIIEDIVAYLYAYSSPTIRIISVKQLHAVERGGKYHRIHLHSQLAVDSEGLSMLAYDKVHNHMNEYIRLNYELKHSKDKNYKKFEGGRFWARLVEGSNTARNIERYLAKAPLLPLRKRETAKQF